MEGVELAMDWQTLAQLAKDGGALAKDSFVQRYATPFLLEVNPETGEALASEDTRGFDVGKIGIGADLSPSLESSQILHFGADASYSLGRGPDAQIRALRDSVSDNHCVFERIGSLWSLRDVGSRNGTYLNGRRLDDGEQAPLKFGSKITLGEAQFLFLGPEDAHDILQELVKEPRIRPRSLGKYRTDFKGISSADEVREQFPGPFLIVQAPKGREAGPGGGPVSTNTVTLSKDELTKGVDRNVADAVFNLASHNLVRIGRATVTQIHLPLGAISNLHCALVRGDGGEWFVQDLGAKNGTYVWGDRLGEERKPLESGTEIMLGNIKSIFLNVEDLITYATHRDTLV